MEILPVFSSHDVLVPRKAPHVWNNRRLDAPLNSVVSYSVMGGIQNPWSLLIRACSEVIFSDTVSSPIIRQWYSGPHYHQSITNCVQTCHIFAIFGEKRSNQTIQTVSSHSDSELIFVFPFFIKAFHANLALLLTEECH